MITLHCGKFILELGSGTKKQAPGDSKGGLERQWTSTGQDAQDQGYMWWGELCCLKNCKQFLTAGRRAGEVRGQAGEGGLGTV